MSRATSPALEAEITRLATLIESTPLRHFIEHYKCRVFKGTTHEISLKDSEYPLYIVVSFVETDGLGDLIIKRLPDDTYIGINQYGESSTDQAWRQLLPIGFHDFCDAHVGTEAFCTLGSMSHDASDQKITPSSLDAERP